MATAGEYKEAKLTRIHVNYRKMRVGFVLTWKEIKGTIK
jgi:hypothetical protein